MAACGPSSSPADAPPQASGSATPGPAGHHDGPHHHAGHGAHAHGEHAHGHHHGDGPLVHRFENAAEWAKEFDKPERDAWQKPAEVVALLQLSAGMKVADVGAGTGYFEPYLSRAVGPTGSVLAIDVEDSMVAYIQERAAREGLTNVTASKGAFDDPKIAPGSVDRVLIVDVWHHVANREAYAAKLRDALAPGGFVAVVDFTLEATHGPPKELRLTADQIKKELTAAGLTAEIVTETLPDQYVVIGRKAAK